MGLPHAVPKSRDIISIVSLITDVSIHDMESHRKTANIVMARRLFHFLTKEMTQLSYPQIGKIVKQDHTTVIHNVTVAEMWMKDRHPQFIEYVRQAKILLKEKLTKGEGKNYDALIRCLKADEVEPKRKPAKRGLRVNRSSPSPLSEAAAFGRVRFSSAE